MTSPTTHLRPATPDDVDAIADVHAVSRDGAYRGHMSDAFLNRRSVEERRAGWVLILDGHDPSAVTWVAERDGRVVGFCHASRDDTPTDAPHVHSLYVLAEAQGSGTGRALLTSTARSLAEAGASSATLHVFAFNAPAIGFYERQGWRREATEPIEGSGDPPVVTHRYRLDLTA